MSFLDGVLKPGDGAEMAVRREMEHRMRRWTRSDHHYRGVGDFLLQHGRFWTGRQLPEQYEHLRGQEMSCYRTALEAAEADPSLRYVEGVYAAVGKDFHGHAWCIDQDDKVVELILPTDPETVSRAVTTSNIPYLPVERWGYFGAVLNTAYVRAHRDARAETHGQAIFDLSPVEEARQRNWSRMAREHGLFPGDFPEDDEDWSEESAEDFPMPDDWPILREPFDPNRTTL